jgi:hypothetical protein
MSNKPAFPQPDFVTDGSTEIQGDSGMDLRDYFAAKTVTWFLTKLDDEGVIDDYDLLRQFAAEHSYKLADAMMKARNAAQ